MTITREGTELSFAAFSCCRSSTFAKQVFLLPQNSLIQNPVVMHIPRVPGHREALGWTGLGSAPCQARPWHRSRCHGFKPPLTRLFLSLGHFTQG